MRYAQGIIESFKKNGKTKSTVEEVADIIDETSKLNLIRLSKIDSMILRGSYCHIGKILDDFKESFEEKGNREYYSRR